MPLPFGKETELNIIILPDEKISEMAIDMSRKAREIAPTNFVLDGRKIIPHVTVYQARFPENNIDKISAYLKTVAEKMSPFELAFGKTSHWNNYVFWNTDATNEYMHLNKSVIYQINPLRDNLILKGLDGKKWNMSETYSIQNYGSLLPGKDYTPHITVTAAKTDQDAQKISQEIRPKIAKFTATKIALGRLGEFGTVTEIMEEFHFSGQGAYNLRPQNYF